VSGRGSKQHFHRAIRKHGVSDFRITVLHTGLNEDEANTLERECIEIHDSRRNGYNMTPGGDGVPLGYPGANKGRVFSTQWRENISKSLSGRKLTDEHKRKINRKGHSVSAEIRAKIAARLLGVPRPPEVVEKIRKANLGRKRTPEIEVTCQCGVVFITRTNTMARKFCSKSCACRASGKKARLRTKSV
jgi:hypothetical protein